MNNKMADVCDIKQQKEDNPNDLINPSFSNNEAFEIDIDAITVNTLESASKKNVRLIYCSDGIVEECEEDEIEKERLEREEREKIIEQRKRLDIEAVN